MKNKKIIFSVLGVGLIVTGIILLCLKNVKKEKEHEKKKNGR